MFDPNAHDPSTGASPQLPEGDLPVAIIGHEIKPTQAGTGSYLQLNLQVSEGPAAGKEGCVRLNMMNPNQQAVDIAYRDLAAICWCIGFMQSFDPLQDCSPLYNKLFRIVVRKQAGEAGEKGYTEVAQYKSYDGDTPARGKQPPQIRPFMGANNAGAGPGGPGVMTQPGMQPGGMPSPNQPPPQQYQQPQQNGQPQQPFQMPVQNNGQPGQLNQYQQPQNGQQGIGTAPSMQPGTNPQAQPWAQPGQ